jgi:ParB-like nuclease domain
MLSGPVLKPETLEIAQIYVPAKRRDTLNPEFVREIAESILEVGLQTPILVRADGDRYVLIEGLHRLEACKALGESTVAAVLGSAHVSTETIQPPYESEMEALRRKTERLRQLRLTNEAAQQTTPTATVQRFFEKHSTPNRNRSALRRPKAPSLVEWLAERERDGLRK